MFTKEEKNEIEQYLNNMPQNSSIYIGCDSIKYKRRGEWYAKYTVAFIIHIASRHGGKIFSFTEVERDYDPKVDKPRMRLMNEVYKSVSTYLEFGELLENLPVQIHIDINPDEEHNSSIVVKEALGYVQGMTGLDAYIKPHSWAASHASDRGARGKLH